MAHEHGQNTLKPTCGSHCQNIRNSTCGYRTIPCPEANHAGTHNVSISAPSPAQPNPVRAPTSCSSNDITQQTTSKIPKIYLLVFAPALVFGSTEKKATQ
ncbi:hypothetical protein HBI59_115240 [Parastagonospora nodorum]|nr:hypothetical protein HBI59_115240 [Parastagonospora nodorum]